MRWEAQIKMKVASPESVPIHLNYNQSRLSTLLSSLIIRRWLNFRLKEGSCPKTFYYVGWDWSFGRLDMICFFVGAYLNSTVGLLLLQCFNIVLAVECSSCFN